MGKRKHKSRNKVVDYLTYILARGVLFLLKCFPVRWNYATFGLMADVFYRVSKRHRLRAQRHVRLSFPEFSEDEVHRVARESLRNMFYLLLEVAFTPRLVKPHNWARRIRLKNMSRTIELLLRHDQPLLMLTGHFGNWEVVGYSMAALGFPSYAVARLLDNPYLNDYVLGFRQRQGMTILDKRGATTMIPSLLDNNEAVSFIADQDAGRRGLFVNFFGRKASTYKSIALLAMQHEIPVIVGYGRRLGRDFRFEIGVEDVIEPADWKDLDDPMTYITQRYTKALEDVIRRDPEQYLWIHRRWKHRPKGEDQPADGIA